MEPTRILKYQYTPLRRRGEIRIIELQPSLNIEDQVNCSISYDTLYNCDADMYRRYIALSYVWGDASDTRTILIEGQELRITVNLDSALRHIRDKTRTARIWADAICINQQDNEEKAFQVRQMADIYRIAQRTLIYLGESTDRSESVLGYLNQRLKQDFAGASDNADFPAPTPIDAHDLIDRPWFKRVWIFQELLLSRDPWVQAGSAKIP